MKAKKLIIYCLAALLAGCVPVVSLQPLFTREDIRFDEKLLGTWVEDANKPKSSWEFTRLEETAADGLVPSLRGEIDRLYRLNVTDAEGRKGSLVACLVKLQDRLFLDVFPDKLPSGEQDMEKTKLVFNAFFFVPAHTFIRVDSLTDSLKVRLTDDDGFKKLLEAEPDAVKFALVEDRPILTASTKELQAFVLKHAGDERLFPGEVTLTRKNK